ncbi:PAP2 family protein [Paludibacter sp. 221]|uniref:phosphatase PAP2 family protein n=1 Tax=Paludibacter sp. 221 TaxID=2302939 RepID=UPI0013D5D56F|nr:phosphatase PAP2 family protein [Paludibacter sp. 221]NDV47256.1 PAP2 family protein [Paludibacter sp. 221]
MRKFTIILLLLGTFSILCEPACSQNTDINLLKNLNNSSPFMRGYSIGFSQTAYATVVAVPVVMGTVGLIKKDEELLRNTIYIGASLAVNTALTYGLKYTIKRERPYDKYPGMLDVPYPESSYSLPSGHSSIAFATATALSLKYPKWYVIAPTYFWACSVAYSRMNLGVHYPTDVLAGALLGAGSAYVTYLVNEWFWKKKPDLHIIW